MRCKETVVRRRETEGIGKDAWARNLTAEGAENAEKKRVYPRPLLAKGGEPYPSAPLTGNQIVTWMPLCIAFPNSVSAAVPFGFLSLLVCN
jgi:hypothetical protein